jgi:Spy/CpxP family protein refolding chaperone
MKLNLVKLGLTALSVVLFTGPSLPSSQQYAAQSGPSGVTLAIGGGVPGGSDRVAALTMMLSLDASQQASAKAIFGEEDTFTKPLDEQLKQASDALLSGQKAAAPDAEIDQLAKNMASISGEILAIDAKAQSKVYSLLSTDQKQKLEQLPHPFFGVSAPLLPPGPVFVSVSGKPGQN